MFLFLQTRVKQTGSVRTEVEEPGQCHDLQHRQERMGNWTDLAILCEALETQAVLLESRCQIPIENGVRVSRQPYLSVLHENVLRLLRLMA